MVGRGGPYVADGVTDGGVDSEWHIAETSTSGGDEDGVNGTGSGGRWEGFLATHGHGAWGSTELSHAF